MLKEKKDFQYFRSFFYSSFVLLIVITSISADDIYSTTTLEVLAYDSVIEEIVINLADVDNLNTTDKVLLKCLKEYPEFEYIIRINSKGKIISKVLDNKILPRDFKFIGNQKWFKTMELLEKPYYGNIIQGKDIFLFWNRPAFVKSSKEKKFAGVISVKINLKKCFHRIAEKNHLKFSLLYGNQTIFTNLNTTNSDNITIRKLSIYGLPGLFIKYEKSILEPVVSKIEEKQEVSQLPELQSLASQSTGSQPSVSEVKQEKRAEKIKFVNTVVDKILYNKSNPNKMHILLYSVGICLLLFSLCIFFINRAIVNITSRKI